MKQSQMDVDLQYSREKMENLMIQAARVKNLGYYLDNDGYRCAPCGTDRERQAKYFLEMAEHEAKQILSILTSVEFKPLKTKLKKEPK